MKGILKGHSMQGPPLLTWLLDPGVCRAVQGARSTASHTCSTVSVGRIQGPETTRCAAFLERRSLTFLCSGAL